MANDHYEKWFIKMPAGFMLIVGGILFMYYSLTHMEAKENWKLFGSISGVAIGTGALLLSSATINKVKSDLIKKQKNRQQLS
jgi:heme/copper-type cytochrome/quinol oxidase subunit 3